MAAKKTTVKEISAFFEEWAPLNLQAEWDNSGLQLGKKSASVANILVALDVDNEVLAYIEANRVDLVITHHPLYFGDIKSLDLDLDLGRITSVFIKRNVSLLSMHTNLDVAAGGVNDCLVKSYGFNPKDGEVFEGGFGLFLENTKNIKYSKLKSKMNCQSYGPSTIKDIKRVGFCAGSGKSLIPELPSKNVDVFITGEAGYHDQIYCELNNIALFVLGHKESEVLVLGEIKKRLIERFSDLKIQVL